jgi:hypothetical protein
MAVQDSVGTFLVRAINTNRPNFAGAMDVLGDIAKIVILSISANDLTHGFGWKGYLGIIPILITAFVVTRHSVKLASKMEHEEEAAEDDNRDRRIAALEQQIKALLWDNG